MFNILEKKVTDNILFDERLMNEIEGIDFSDIKMKLQHKVDGLSWDKKTVDGAEFLYKKYFYLLVKGYNAAPTKIIDDFWHFHILDTKKYREDCVMVAKRFIDHYPYLGLKNDEDKLSEAFEETKTLFKSLFGIDLVKKSQEFGLNSSSSGCNGGGSTGCGQHYPKKL